MDQRYQSPNDFEAFIREKAARHARPLIVVAVVVVLVLVAGATAFFQVPADSDAVVKRFGEVVRIEGPGLHFKIPFGVESATTVPVRRVLKEEFGFRTVSPGEQTTYRSTPQMKERESLMLTGDLNVIDVEWVVQYKIVDPDKWLHRVRDPRETIRDISEAVMRRIIGNHLSSEALTVARAEIAEEVRLEMQRILNAPDEANEPNEYDMGIHVGSVEMQDVTPPDAVKPAFNEVNKARQERESLINQAQKKRNQVLPRARGQAEQTIAESEAYKTERVNTARGEASRFTAILKEYRQGKQVTRRRLYLEAIDDILPGIGKVYVVEGGTSQPLPLLEMNTDNAPVRRGGQQ